MAKIKFRDIHLSIKNKVRLQTINSIIEEYQADGYVLTLRQLYYQLVSRDIIPNISSEYSKLSKLLKEGRMAGIVDWDAIEDRLRKPSSPSSFESPQDILEAAISQYQLPRMGNQDTYLEVWVEKDALSGVLSRVTNRYHVPILVNRGYSSASAMFDSFTRFKNAHENGQNIKVLYLGDFDPSGVDMIRDIQDRTNEFISGDFTCFDLDFKIDGIALTMQQIRQYNPPPNPAKVDDPRAKEYIKINGSTSWEVDALPPTVLNQILEDEIKRNIDEDVYKEIVSREAADIKKLKTLITYL